MTKSLDVYDNDQWIGQDELDADARARSSSSSSPKKRKKKAGKPNARKANDHYSSATGRVRPIITPF
jgi:hypothetical protein